MNVIEKLMMKYFPSQFTGFHRSAEFLVRRYKRIFFLDHLSSLFSYLLGLYEYFFPALNLLHFVEGVDRMGGTFRVYPLTPSFMNNALPLKSLIVGRKLRKPSTFKSTKTPQITRFEVLVEGSGYGVSKSM